MSNELLIAILVSELISVILVMRLWFFRKLVPFKVVLSIIAIIPFLGPFLYAFCSDTTPPQDPALQNRSYRGAYTHHWITMSPLYKSILKQKQEESEESNGENT